jgi:hypothetical protein
MAKHLTIEVIRFSHELIKFKLKIPTNYIDRDLH